jgi:thiol-disulfide isomerase/thioredoxin
MKQISVFFIFICLAGCFGAEPQKTGKEGKPMPEFSLLLTDSITKMNTLDIPVGKPTVLIYYSPYCPYCKAQTKTIIENIDKLKDIQFYFISNFPLPEQKSFIKEYQLEKYPNIISSMDNANIVRDYFEITGIPYLAIYGKNKKLNKTFVGKIYSSQLQKVAEE